MKEFAFNYIIWGISPWLFIIVGGTLGGVLSWKLMNAKWSNRRKMLLAILRGAVIAIIIFLMFEPKFSFHEEKIIYPATSIVIDNSKSMTGVSESGKTRIAEAVDVAKNILLPTLCSHDTPLRKIFFGGTIVRLPKGTPFSLPKKSMDSTDIAAGLIAAGADDILPPKNIFMFTDGFWNAGTDPIPFAKKMHNSGAKLFCIYPDLISSKRGKNNIKQLYLCGSQVVNAGEKCHLLLVVLKNTDKNVTAKLQMNIGKHQNVINRTIAHNNQKTVFVEKLEFTVPETIGEKKIEVVLRYGDNSKNRISTSIGLMVQEKRKSDKVNVLYLDSDLRFQYRFICESFLRESNFELNGNMIIDNAKIRKNLSDALQKKKNVFNGTDVIWVHNIKELNHAPADQAISEILKSADLKQYQVILLSKPNKLIANSVYAKKILNATSAGANLFMIVTSNFTQWLQTDIGKAIITTRKTEIKPVMYCCRFKKTSKFENPLGFAIPKRSSHFRVFDSPRLTGFETLLSAENYNGSKRYPLIMRKRYGLGNIFLVLSDEIWHLDFYDFRKFRDIYRQFWRKLSVYKLNREQNFKIIATPPYALNNDDIKFDISSNQKIKLKDYRIIWDGDEKTSEPLASFEYHVGNSEVIRTFNDTGYHSLAVVDANDALKQNFRFVVVPHHGKVFQEVPSTDVNISFLKKLASAGGGVAMPFSKIKVLRDKIAANTKKTVFIEKDERFMDFWFLMLIILLLLCVDWGIRMFKRNNVGNIMEKR